MSGVYVWCVCLACMSGVRCACLACMSGVYVCVCVCLVCMSGGCGSWRQPGTVQIGPKLSRCAHHSTQTRSTPAGPQPEFVDHRASARRDKSQVVPMATQAKHMTWKVSGP